MDLEQAYVYYFLLVIEVDGLIVDNMTGIFIREASSRIYSPYVFAIGQLLGEIPYSTLCAILYWVLMVCPLMSTRARISA